MLYLIIYVNNYRLCIFFSLQKRDVKRQHIEDTYYFSVVDGNSNEEKSNETRAKKKIKKKAFCM